MVSSFRIVFPVGLFALGAFACSLTDDERCPGGFEFHSPSETCLKSADTDKPPVTSSDGGDGSTDTDTGLEPGIGLPCQNHGDCAEYQADFCVLNPVSKNNYCSMEPCTDTGCPEEYICCDCTDSPLDQVQHASACLTTDDAYVARTFAYCRCGQ